MPKISEKHLRQVSLYTVLMLTIYEDVEKIHSHTKFAWTRKLSNLSIR